MKHLKKLGSWIRKHRLEASVLVALLVVSGVVHAWNMNGYPYFENDEATYISRGWAFATEGRLDVYTYRYDHAPLGWIILGTWLLISGGTTFFDSLLESGRFFMLLVHLASSLLVYILAKRFSRGSKVAAVAAVLMFSLSPLAIYFNRRVLLDNIMTFWLLLSLLLVSQPEKKLKQFVWSGITFGIATLTKLNAVFVGPAFIYILWRRTRSQQRIHAIMYWLAMAGIVVGSFFLFAALKGELLSAPVGPDGAPTHVSVADTFALQLGRGEFAWPWDPKGSFIQNILTWALKDWFILVAGMVSTIVVTLAGVKYRKKQPYLLLVGILVWCFVAFLARGKLVIDLYIVPVIPLLALAFGMFVHLVYNQWLHGRVARSLSALAMIALVLVGTNVAAAPRHFYVDETSNQKQGLKYALENIPRDAIIAADNYVYPTLVQEHGFSKVSYFFSTEYDPELRRWYDDDWRNIEYLIVTHEVVKQIKAGTVPRMKDVLDHSVLLADYQHDVTSYIDLKNYISTNGDWVRVYKTKDRGGIVRQDSWGYFKSRFIIDYGQVVDLTNKELTTSGGQAGAMLRALEEDDYATFRGVWQWSKDHLQYRSTDKMLSWKWEKQPDGGKYKLGDSNNVCDADQQLAYALLKGGAEWKDEQLTADGRTILKDWWEECVFERGGRLYLESSADGSQDVRLMNTGYFNPAHYHYFKTVEPALPWQQLIDDGYTHLAELQALRGYLPDWQIINTGGVLGSARPYVGQAADDFGYDAAALIPRLTADYHVSGDPRARTLLQQLVPTVRDFAASNDTPAARTALLLASQAAGQTDKAVLQTMYEQTVHQPYDPREGRWHDGFNYRDQVWMWTWHSAQPKLPDASRVTIR